LPENGEQLLDVVDHFDSVGTRLPLNGEDYATHTVEPCRRFVRLNAIDHAAELFQADRVSVLPSHNDWAVGGGVGQLPARLNGERLLFSVQFSGRQVGVVLADGP